MSREAANALFKAGDLAGAAQLYSRVLESLGRPAESDEACAVLTNRALCHLRLDNATAAEADCTAVLDAKPGSEKALYRRALAREVSLRGACRIGTIIIARISTMRYRHRAAREMPSRMPVGCGRLTLAMQMRPSCSPACGLRFRAWG